MAGYYQFPTAGDNRGAYKTLGYDTLRGTTGDDTIQDTTAAGSQNTWVYGGDGNDSILSSAVAGAFTSVFYGQGGNDVLKVVATTGSATLDGGIGNDTLTGGTADDKLYGGDGNDVADGGAGNNSIYGDAGNDTLSGGAGNDMIYGGTGTDSIVTGAGTNLVYGEDGADNITGGAVNDTIYGGAGADVINAGAGTNYVEGGDDADTVTLAATAVDDTVLGGAGNDTITTGDLGASVAFVNLDGGAGDDVINATASTTNAGVFKLIGGEGNDVLLGGVGLSVNTILGGAGADSIVGGVLADTITGGTGADTITLGGAVANILNFATGDGADVVTDVTANIGASTLKVTGTGKSGLTASATDTKWTVKYGTTDSITFARGNWGTSTADGENFAIGDAAVGVGATYGGANIFYAGKSTTNDTVIGATAGAATYDLTDTAKYYSVEILNNAAATTANSKLRGTTGADTLIAAAGAGVAGGPGDQLWGRAGADSLVAGAGNDTLWYGAGEGADSINGSAAGDVIKLYNVNAANVTYTMNGGNLEVSFAGSTDKLIVEGWTTAGAKFVTADNLTPFTPTLSSGDTLIGAAAATAALDIGSSTTLNNINNAAGTVAGQVLRGNASANVLKAANAAGDQLWGRAGADTLIAGATTGGAGGSDTLWAGSGEGSKTITGYDVSAAATADVIRLYKDNLSTLTFTDNGTNEVISFAGSTDTVTVSGATGSVLRVATADKTTPFYVALANSGNGDVTYYDAATSFSAGTSATNKLIVGAATAAATTFDLADATRFYSVENIDSSLNTFAGNKLRGNAENNILIGGSAGDKLWGRAGNDTLQGGAGADVFYFGTGEGNDVINASGFAAAADKVMLWNVASVSSVAVSASGSDLVLTVGSNTLTVKGGVGTLVGNTNRAIQVADGTGYNVSYNAATDTYSLS